MNVPTTEDEKAWLSTDMNVAAGMLLRRVHTEHIRLTYLSP